MNTVNQYDLNNEELDEVSGGFGLIFAAGVIYGFVTA